MKRLVKTLGAKAFSKMIGTKMLKLKILAVKKLMF